VDNRIKFFSGSDEESNREPRILIVCQSSFSEAGFELRRAIRKTWAAASGGSNVANVTSPADATAANATSASGPNVTASPTVADHNVANQNVAHRNVSNQNVADHNVANQSVVDQNVEDRSVADRNVAIVFLLGTTDDEVLQRRLQEESDTYRDILQVTENPQTELTRGFESRVTRLGDFSPIVRVFTLEPILR
jgi:hypothetical protein